MTNKTIAVLITDTGAYDAELQPAWHHVILGTYDEAGMLQVKGSALICNGCAPEDEDTGSGWAPDYEYSFDASMYVVLSDDVQYSNLKLLSDSVYFMSDMTGTEVQGFHIDEALGGPEGYAITGTQLHMTQPKFHNDDALYLWEADQVEVLPATTTH